MVGRLTASILQSANLGVYIARSLKEYVDLAEFCYKEGIRNIESRKKLREEIRKSNLGMPERVAKYIEQICECQLTSELNKSSSTIMSSEEFPS